MKKAITLINLIALIGSTSIYADSMNVTIEPFVNPTTFTLSAGVDDLRFAELFPTQGSNTSTHIVIEGLYPLAADETVYSSNYYGVDINNGAATMDTGTLYFTLPTASAPTEGVVTSPIVGIVARTGGWSNFGVTTPNTDLGGATGASNFDSTAGTLDISLNSGDYSASGVSYTVIDTETLELESFTVSGPATSSYAFNSTVLARNGGQFVGVLAASDNSVGYDSLLYEVVLDNIADADFDGIPDIVDDSVVAASLEIEQGVWKSFPSVGDVYGSNADFGYSTSLKFIHVGDFPILWQATLGWLRYLSSPTNDSAIYYSYSTGNYLYFADTSSPSYVEYSSAGSEVKTL